MKKFRRMLLLLLLIPFCFSFASCKNKSKDNGGGNDGGSGEQNPNENVSTESFSVAYDFNLPEKYDFLLTDYTVSNNDVGKSVELATISDVNLAPHFLGWFDSSDNEVTESVTSNVATTIELKGKWNEQNIDKYYYTEGLSFDVDNNNAVVSECLLIKSNIIIPNVYVSGGTEYPVIGVKDSVFENITIQNVIVNADSLSIGDSAFKNTKLTSFDFSKVNEIGESSFENTKITEVKFATSLTSVGASAFKDCKNLTSVDFSNKELSVKDYTFSGCESLSTITNANNLLNIGINSFAVCKGLTNTNFLTDCTKLEFINENAFLNCVNLESVVIPDCVLYIFTPFEGCSKLSELTLSRSYAVSESGSDSLLRHIGNVASSLNKITFVGSSTSKLAMYYFAGLDELETFVMCDSIMYVSDYAFYNCEKLQNITFSNNIDLSSFSYFAFYGTKFLNDRTEPLIYKNTIMYVPQNIVAEYTIPSGVTQINSYAFSGRNTLTKITIPATIEKIAPNAFYDCNNLEEVVFAENNKLTKIEKLTFAFCEKLTKINLQSLTSLTEIEVEAFKYTGFSKFVLPSTVTTLGVGVFNGMPLEEFEVLGTGGVFSVIDGVLYKDVSEPGSDAELMLWLYPKYKQGAFFACPENVTKIAAYAFVGVDTGENNLKYVYFENDDVEFEVTTDSHGNPKYDSFRNGIKILRNTSDLDIQETGIYIYEKLSSGCAWNFESQTIDFEEEFSAKSGYYYLVFLDDDALSIAVFEYVSAGDDSGIKEGTLVKLDKVLSAL